MPQNLQAAEFAPLDFVGWLVEESHQHGGYDYFPLLALINVLLLIPVMVVIWR